MGSMVNPSSYPMGMPNSLPTSMPGSMPSSMPGSIPSSMPGSISGSMPNSMPGSMYSNMFNPMGHMPYSRMGQEGGNSDGNARHMEEMMRMQQQMQMYYSYGMYPGMNMMNPQMGNYMNPSYSSFGGMVPNKASNPVAHSFGQNSSAMGNNPTDGLPQMGPGMHPSTAMNSYQAMPPQSTSILPSKREDPQKVREEQKKLTTRQY